MPAEVEAKFRAESTDALEALAVAPSVGFATLGPAVTIDESDRYLDTADGRLGAAAWACMHTVRDGATRVSLKGPAQPTDGAWHHRRPEIEGPATDSLDPDDWPPSDARDEVERLAAGAPLVERFTLRQRRTERAVLVDGRPVGVLSLDAVEVVGAAPGRESLLVVELELAEERSLDTAELERLAGALLARGDLRPDPRTKLEHALERLAAT